MPKGKIEFSDIVLSLWGVVLAFAVQVMYDIFGGSFYTAFMPKIWWGLVIVVALSALLLIYMRQLLRQRVKSRRKA